MEELWNDVLKLRALEELLHEEYQQQLRYARAVSGNFAAADNIYKHLAQVQSAIKRLEDHAVAARAA
ncbi:MAG: hypothetical protein HY330_07640 [Chloroflexi bacterium]|nr:hypothetical protein [Chloroflexota bacterium]